MVALVSFFVYSVGRYDKFLSFLASIYSFFNVLKQFGSFELSDK